MVALLATLRTLVSVAQVLSLLFGCSGARTETPSRGVYWSNTAAVSLANRRLLSEIVEGLALWACRIRTNSFTFVSKIGRPEAALIMGRSPGHFFKTVESAVNYGASNDSH